MEIVTKLAVALVAVLHLGFLYLEMFLWKTPKGQKIFRIDAEFAAKSAALAANQGLYNGFLAAGLIWSLLSSGEKAFELQVFFLSCVIVAGIYGAMTVSKNILKLQCLPAILALVFVFLSR